MLEPSRLTVMYPRSINPLALFAQRKFAQLSEVVDTGPDSDIKRSLVIFNPTTVPVTGRAIFPVDMPWRRGEQFPFIAVREMQTDHVVLHEIDGVQWSSFPAAENADADKLRLRFLMAISVSDVPANGYATYIASFEDDTDQAPKYERPVFRPDLVVVESRGHGGALPGRGALVRADDRKLIVYVGEPPAQSDNVVPITVANNLRETAVDRRLSFAAGVGRATRLGSAQSAALVVDGDTLILPPIRAGEALKLLVETSA